jgi:hypothetical protein
MADMCCGEYTWISRHFSKMSNKIYCVDKEEKALNSKLIRENKRCIAIKRDASKKIFDCSSLDFIYCGFTVHYNFIKNFICYLRPKGAMFLMKPLDGDDFYLRSKFELYDIKKRSEEIKKITIYLNRRNLSIKTFLYKCYWIFYNPDIDKILAALSIVTMGDRKLLSNKEYNFAIKFLNSRLEGHKLKLYQRWRIWEVIKNGNII